MAEFDSGRLWALGFGIWDLTRIARMSVFSNPASGAADQAAAYVKAVLELLGDRDPSDVLREMPSALSRAIDCSSPTRYTR